MIAGLLAIATLVSVSDTIDISLTYILLRVFPVVVYGLYMLFLSPWLTDKIELTWKKSMKLAGRLAAFIFLIFLTFVIIDSLLKGEIKAVEKELAARGAKGDKNDPKKSRKMMSEIV